LSEEKIFFYTQSSNAHLAELYLDGTLEKNEEKARELMLIAAQDETDKRSMTRMAIYYLTGLGG
jgi:TPR repeat protein